MLLPSCMSTKPLAIVASLSTCFPDLVVEQYVPAGTCATFACELSTGENIQVGGCHL